MTECWVSILAPLKAPTLMQLKT